jgi:hypothetical protein
VGKGRRSPPSRRCGDYAKLVASVGVWDTKTAGEKHNKTETDGWFLVYMGDAEGVVYCMCVVVCEWRCGECAVSNCTVVVGGVVHVCSKDGWLSAPWVDGRNWTLMGGCEPLPVKRNESGC